MNGSKSTFKKKKKKIIIINVTLSAKTSLMLGVHKAGFRREGHINKYKKSDEGTVIPTPDVRAKCNNLISFFKIQSN